MVCACASARSRETTAAPTAPTRSRTKTTRNHFMPKPPLAISGGPAIVAGWKKVPNPSTRSRLESTGAPAREDQPLEAAPALGGGRGGRRFLKNEARSEVGFDALARNGKGRAVRALAQRIEAAEEEAARPEDVMEHVDVLASPSGIDSAEARVLPHRVEGSPVVRGQGEDVAPLEGHADALLLGEPACLAHRGLREVEAGDLVAAAGEKTGVVTAPRAGHGHTGAGRQGQPGLQALDQSGRGLAELPAVLPRRVEPLPEGGRAYGRAIAGHSTCSKSATALSAPALTSSSSAWAVVTPTARMPARRAACTPTNESSKTRQRSGATRRRAAASRYTSGSGLPHVTSSAVTMTSK